MSDSPSENLSAFCSLCSFLSVSSLDHDSKINAGVCRECFLKFVEPNQEKWQSGWRPGKREIKKFKDTRRKSVYSILRDIDNYI
jgi:hypothetical protein